MSDQATQLPTGTITALTPQQHNPQRVSIFVDGAFALGVSVRTVAETALAVGRMLTTADYEQLLAVEHTEQAVQVSLRFLQQRPRSTAEVRQRLERDHYPEASITATLARLTRAGLLDDAAFARAWVASRNATNPRGVQMLRLELQRKGVDRAILDAVLADEELVADEYHQALAVAHRRLARSAAIHDYATLQRRLGGYLQRRGYTYDTIRRVLEVVWRQQSTDPSSTGEAEP